MADSCIWSPPAVRERPGKRVLRLHHLVYYDEFGSAAQRLLQDALGGSFNGAAHLCMTRTDSIPVRLHDPKTGLLNTQTNSRTSSPLIIELHVV